MNQQIQCTAVIQPVLVSEDALDSCCSLLYCAGPTSGPELYGLAQRSVLVQAW